MLLRLLDDPIVTARFEGSVWVNVRRGAKRVWKSVGEAYNFLYNSRLSREFRTICVMGVEFGGIGEGRCTAVMPRLVGEVDWRDVAS